MHLIDYIEDKAQEFYNGNFEQFSRDVVNYNQTFEKYMNKNNYFRIYVVNEAGYDIDKLIQIFNLSKKDVISLKDEGIANKFEEDLYYKIKAMFAQGIINVFNEIDLELKYEDHSGKSLEILKNKRKKLGKELTRMFDI